MKIIELYTKEETKNLKMGLSVLGIILLIFLIVLFSRSDIAPKGEGTYYQVFARFNRTDGLQVGDAVRLSGIDVGRVTDAKLDENFKAILKMEINDKVKLPDDSSAAIVSFGIMGKKYIEIEPGGSEDMLASGDEFAYTQDAMVLEELIERIIGIGKAKRQGNKVNKEETKENE